MPKRNKKIPKYFKWVTARRSEGKQLDLQVVGLDVILNSMQAETTITIVTVLVTCTLHCTRVQIVSHIISPTIISNTCSSTPHLNQLARADQDKYPSRWRWRKIWPLKWLWNFYRDFGRVNACTCLFGFSRVITDC